MRTAKTCSPSEPQRGSGSQTPRPPLVEYWVEKPCSNLSAHCTDEYHTTKCEEYWELLDNMERLCPCLVCLGTGKTWERVLSCKEQPRPDTEGTEATEAKDDTQQKNSSQ